jgi:signal peptidase I
MVVDRTAQVHRGDVIVEQQSPGVPGSYYVRRVIGLPGDHVTCCDAHGRITVNGKALNETYLYPGDSPSEIRFDITLPKGKMWLLGDHRSRAFDSRLTGPVAVKVIGRVFLVLHSSQPIFLHTPQTFIADGLAPAADDRPPAVIGAGVIAITPLALLVLVILGAIRFALRTRRKRSAVSSASIAV